MDPAEQILQVYWRPGCSACTSLRLALNDAGITASWRNIRQDPAAAAWVRGEAGGYGTVPTVAYGDRVVVASRPDRVVEDLRIANPDLPIRLLHGAAGVVLERLGDELAVTVVVLDPLGHHRELHAADDVDVLVVDVILGIVVDVLGILEDLLDLLVCVVVLGNPRSTSAPSGPAWRSRTSTWSWSSPAARLPRRAPQTASAELMPAWMAKLVAAMLRPAARSLAAASANSSALAA